EARVGELDRNFRGQLALPDFLEHPQIVVAYAGGLVAAHDLLAQLGQHAADAVPNELRGGRERRVEVFSGHESPHGAAEEGALGQLPGEPGAAGRAQQEVTGERHGQQEIRAMGDWGRGCRIGLLVIQLYHSYDTCTVACSHLERALRSAPGTTPVSTRVAVLRADGSLHRGRGGARPSRRPA